MTPLIGRRVRYLRSSERNSSQPAASAPASESCVVNRPAVSRNTASSVNHQSQLRVPPTPRSAPRPDRCSSGKCSPEFTSAVVLPEPGAPMITYHGSSYRVWPPRRFCFSVAVASSNRSRSCSASGLGRSSAFDCFTTAATSLSLARNARSFFRTIAAKKSTATMAIAIQRAVSVSSGR